MAKKTSAQKLDSIVRRLTRKFSPDVIQGALAGWYEDYAAVSKTDAEIEFWLKCSKASKNLSSGMNKWAHEMVEDLEELEEEEE